MKTKFLCALAGSMSLICIQAGVQESRPQIGRLDLDKNLAIEYRVIPFDKKVYKASEGRIGPVFGTDGGVPITKFEGLTLIQGKRRIPLDISSMYDPSFGQIERRQFRVQHVNARRLILTGTFSDAAGSYVAEWLVVDGASVRTLLSNDPSTVRDKLLR